MKPVSTRIRDRLALHKQIMDIHEDPDLMLLAEAADVLEFMGRVMHQLLVEETSS
jgi:hypothetical protein